MRQITIQTYTTTFQVICTAGSEAGAADTVVVTVTSDNDAPTANAAQGGLIGLKHGGEVSGMVPGNGHGMEDNVYMPIKEKGHGKQIGTLAVSPSEYVVDAHTMSALGNGNPDAGAEVMDTVIESVRKKAYGTIRQPNEINGLNALMPMMERV